MIASMTDRPSVSGTNRKWYSAVSANCRRDRSTTPRSMAVGFRWDGKKGRELACASSAILPAPMLTRIEVGGKRFDDRRADDAREQRRRRGRANPRPGPRPGRRPGRSSCATRSRRRCAASPGSLRRRRRCCSTRWPRSPSRRSCRRGRSLGVERRADACRGRHRRRRGSVARRRAWLALVLGSAAARGACAWAFGRAGAAAAATVKARVRRAVVAAALRGALATTETTAAPPSRGAAETTSGAFLGLAVDEVEALDAHAARFVASRRAAVLAPLLVLVAAAFASPVAALILAATLLPFVLLIALAGGASADESRRQFSALARLSGLFADRLRACPSFSPAPPSGARPTPRRRRRCGGDAHARCPPARLSSRRRCSSSSPRFASR